jgi:CheY-like chemotaxis protein
MRSSVGEVGDLGMDTSAVTVLVVDDAPDMRFLARAVLESSGLTVVSEAADGPEALERVRDLDPPPVPTVILLDNMMPGLTGLEVAERVLADMPDQLIVLFSAYLSDEVAAEAARLGVTACVSKVDVSNLGEIIRKIVEDRA